MEKALWETAAASKITHRHSRNERTDEVVVSSCMTAQAEPPRCVIWCDVYF